MRYTCARAHSCSCVLAREITETKFSVSSPFSMFSLFRRTRHGLDHNIQTIRIGNCVCAVWFGLVKAKKFCLFFSSRVFFLIFGVVSAVSVLLSTFHLRFGCASLLTSIRYTYKSFAFTHTLRLLSQFSVSFWFCNQARIYAFLFLSRLLWLTIYQSA